MEPRHQQPPVNRDVRAYITYPQAVPQLAQALPGMTQTSWPLAAQLGQRTPIIWVQRQSTFSRGKDRASHGNHIHTWDGSQHRAPLTIGVNVGIDNDVGGFDLARHVGSEEVDQVTVL